RIDDDEVEAFRLLLRDRQPRIADHDVRLRLAVVQKAELLRRAGDLHHKRIDLEEAPMLTHLRVAGERAGAEPDDAEAALAAVPGEPLPHLADRERHGAFRMIVGRRSQVVLIDAAAVPDALGAMQSRTVGEDVEVAVARHGHTVDAEVAALGLAALDA